MESKTERANSHPHEANAAALQREFWSRDQSGRRSPHHPAVRALYEPRVEYIASLVPEPAQASILDVGCGNGFMTVPLERRFGRVVGLDQSEAMLAVNPCREKRQGSACDLPFADGEFDLAVANHLLHHLTRADRVRTVREMARVARRGVIVYEPNRNNPAMFLFGLLKPEERMSLEFTRGHVRSLLQETGLPQVSVRAEGLLLPNKAPAWWVPVGKLLECTPLRACGFYLRGVALSVGK
jgi:SAM-dependent methyltransferase